MESIISYKRIINALRIALGYINKKGKTPKEDIMIIQMDIGKID